MGNIILPRDFPTAISAVLEETRKRRSLLAIGHETIEAYNKPLPKGSRQSYGLATKSQAYANDHSINTASLS